MGYYFDRLFVVRFILTDLRSADEIEVDFGVAVTLGSLATSHTLQIESDRFLSAVPYLLLPIGDDRDRVELLHDVFTVNNIACTRSFALTFPCCFFPT